jgi:putative transposase
LRANLVGRAEDWRWCGLWHRRYGSNDHLISNWPVPRPTDWIARVNQPLSHKELKAIRNSTRRGAPFGNPDWVRRTARHLGLEYAIRPLGRPCIVAR